jgi:hypothetical protein
MKEGYFVNMVRFNVYIGNGQKGLIPPLLARPVTHPTKCPGWAGKEPREAAAALICGREGER